MRVLFDAYWWVEGPAAVRRVMKQIVTTWHEQFPDDEIGMVVRRRHHEIVRADMDQRVTLFASSMRPQAVLATVGVAAAARRFRPDLILTHNFAMPGRRSTVYLHDLMFRTNPEWFTRKELAYFSAMAPLAKRAEIVFTSSESEAERIRRYVSRRPVVPVGIGIDDDLLESASASPRPELQQRGFLLAVGRLNQRKNLGRVIEATVSSDLVTPDFPMVVAGEPDGAVADLPDVARRAQEDGRLKLLGFVSDEELHWLYTNARATTYVSLDEGYGMPPLESLALGTPVVVSDIGVMRENLGDLARYADPKSTRSIQQAIRAELDTPLDDRRVAVLTNHGRGRTWPAVVASIRDRSLEVAHA